MKTKPSRTVFFSLLVSIFAAVIPFSVYAAEVLAVTPGVVINNVDTTITVSGTGFDATAVVLLDGSALSTSFLNDHTLTAVVPAGISAGAHTITVSMSGGAATGSASLTIQTPAPIPATATPEPFARPQFAVYSSKLDGKVTTNGNITLKVVIENVGKSTAYNTQAAFTSSELVPTKNGGVAVVGTVEYDQEMSISQTFYVSAEIYGQSVITVAMLLTYYDQNGASYSDTFTLSIPVTGAPLYSGPAAATATPTGVKSSQLVITGYSTDVEPLQPGEQFKLSLNVQNTGNANAQRITMIVGGGSSGTSGSTPQPGGVSGGSGDFSNFAPLGASNVQSLGDLKSGETIQISQNLIVNVSANPGAYPMRISFSYMNDNNEIITDEQVITLLVYALPTVNISFYRSPDPFFAGQPGMLPLQIVNVGRRFSVLGDMKIETAGGYIENGTGLVGSLDAGGYFTLDATLYPDQPGMLTLDISIEYVDDFNQPRTIEKQLDVEILESYIEPEYDPALDPNMGGTGDWVPYEAEETVLHKIFRLIKGLLGLDSAWPVWQAPGG